MIVTNSWQSAPPMSTPQFRRSSAEHLPACASATARSYARLLSQNCAASPMTGPFKQNKTSAAGRLSHAAARQNWPPRNRLIANTRATTGTIAHKTRTGQKLAPAKTSSSQRLVEGNDGRTNALASQRNARDPTRIDDNSSPLTVDLLDVID